MDGILVVNKEKNMTSHDVVGITRKVLKTKKVGHAGTLDPLATGVLVLGIGRATKLLQFLSADHKQYRATLKLGIMTDTYDCEGKVLEMKPYLHDLNEEQVRLCLNSFLGDSMQVPPIYSALKKNGKPLYEYARNNEKVEIEARPIHIDALNLVSFVDDTIVFDVLCSKGTYVRSLCVDIAKALGYPGMMSDLCREESGQYTLKEAISIADLKAGNFNLLNIDEALGHMPRLVIEDENIVIHGKRIKADLEGQVAVYNTSGKLLAVYEKCAEGEMKSVRGLFS